MSPYDASPDDAPPPAAPPPATAAGGVTGRLAMTWRVSAGTTRLRDLAQRTPYRLLRPHGLAGEPPLAVVANVSGGVVGGDRLELSLELGQGAALAVTGQAAEKVYRAGGRLARVENRIAVGAGARLDWLPQGTILFDDVRLRRETEIALAAGAALLWGECLVFGRRGMGETLARGAVEDRLTVAVDGRTVLVDRFRMDDPATLLADPFGLDGAEATALALIHHSDTGPLLDAVRAMLAEAGGEGFSAGATRRGPLVLVRWLGRDAASLRRALGRFWGEARARVCGFPARLPVVWAI